MKQHDFLGTTEHVSCCMVNYFKYGARKLKNAIEHLLEHIGISNSPAFVSE